LDEGGLMMGDIIGEEGHGSYDPCRTELERGEKRGAREYRKFEGLVRPHMKKKTFYWGAFYDENGIYEL